MALKTRVSWMVAGCLVAGMSAGVAAQLTTRPVRYFNCGISTLVAGQRGFFYLGIDDVPKQPSVRARLQFIDRSGTVVASKDVTLAAGQSTSLEIAGPAQVRAHGELVGSTTEFTARRTDVGSVEVIDELTGEIRPVCSADGQGSPGGRQ